MEDLSAVAVGDQGAEKAWMYKYTQSKRPSGEQLLRLRATSTSSSSSNLPASPSAASSSAPNLENTRRNDHFGEERFLDDCIFDDIFEGNGELLEFTEDIKVPQSASSSWQESNGHKGDIPLRSDAECQQRFASNPFEQAFELIMAALEGNFHKEIPVRMAASPVPKDVACFYVVPAIEEQENKMIEEPELVSVKYQSFASGKVWWSPRTGGHSGVVARAMNRGVRISGTLGEKHGFTGRWFSLVNRSNLQDTVKGAKCRSAVSHGAPSLVFMWQNSHSAKHVPKIPVRVCVPQYMSSVLPEIKEIVENNKVCGKAVQDSQASPQENADATLISHGGSYGSDSSFTESKFLQRYEELPFTKPRGMELISEADGFVNIYSALHVRGKSVVAGNAHTASISTQGSLRAMQGIHGLLTTSPKMADYAEWFELMDQHDKVGPGDVVQLRSPQQRVSKSTSGYGPLLVVSTSPSIAAGVPESRRKQLRGVLCGFLGQVPVKCMGPVECGDLLVPSGLHDGFAIAGRRSHADQIQPLGYAMETCGDGEHMLNCLVRWDSDPRWKILREQRISELHYKWYWEVLPKHAVSILVRFILLKSSAIEPTFSTTTAFYGLGMECCLVAVLVLTERITGRWVQTKPFLSIYKTFMSMYLLSQTFSGCSGSENVSPQDLSKLGLDIGFLLIDIGFRLL